MSFPEHIISICIVWQFKLYYDKSAKYYKLLQKFTRNEIVW